MVYTRSSWRAQVTQPTGERRDWTRWNDIRYLAPWGSTAARWRGRWGRPVIRVLVAEDARVIRETLVALLGPEDGMEVAAAVASGDLVVPPLGRTGPTLRCWISACLAWTVSPPPRS